ncbi:MAG: polysaccharide pyruvyl transferase family protein [Clostridiales bacterium]|jgi:hypothetical protein|nr:polysaccharide pyruvyl transferase family protein [Clostridiales bacterium]
MKYTYLAVCYFHGNYGSILQAFATQEYLKKVGIANRTICIDGLQGTIKKRKLIFFLTQILNKDVYMDKYPYLKLWLKRKTNVALNRNIAIRRSIFRSFIEQKFDLTQAFASFEELERACARDCRSVLVGSDQLWLPANIEADYYTLSFVPDTVRKLAYATSFGVAELSGRQARKAASFLQRFYALSVRELSGQRIVERLTGAAPPVVCDPVLLFSADEWVQYCPLERKYKNKYILCYLLGVEVRHYEWVKALSAETGFPVVGLINLDAYVPEAEKIADFKPYDISPFDFIGLIRNADYVCTDSYHAVAFSLLFHKKMFVFKRFVKDFAMSTNSRLESLSATLGMGTFTSWQTPLRRAIDISYDYEAIDGALARFREYSKYFLQRAL